jgi:hypothetical protein
MKRKNKLVVGVSMLSLVAITAAQGVRVTWADDVSTRDTGVSSEDSSGDSERDSQVSSQISTGIMIAGAITTTISLIAGNQHKAEALFDQAAKGDGDELRLLALLSRKTRDEVSDIVLDVEPSRPLDARKLKRLESDLGAKLLPKKAAQPKR